MVRANHLEAIAQLSESEGVFTTAQAERMGIPRDALHDAVESGRLERVIRGAYRMVGAGSSYTDELAAIWKLTAPENFSYERMRSSNWDGIVIGGATASSLLELGDLYLSPYRIYAPKRINSRKTVASFAKRKVARDEVTFVQGLPVTRPERIVFDLVLDDEDLSLVADVLREAAYVNRDFDFENLANYLRDYYSASQAKGIYEGLLADAGLLSEKDRL